VQSAQPAANTDLCRTGRSSCIRRFCADQYQAFLDDQPPYPVEHIAITMALLDRDNHVTGFRRMLLEPDRRMEPGESMALTMKVIPQGSNTVGFDAFAEGFFVAD
jgi:hypothetical protein